MRMTRTVDDQLAPIEQNYFRAYVALAQANIRPVEESAYVRQPLLAIAEPGDNAAKLDQLRQQAANTGKTSDERIANARQYINRQIADPLDFDDNIALARLVDKIEALQEERQRYESVLAKLLTAANAGNKPQTAELLSELDDWRDRHRAGGRDSIPMKCDAKFEEKNGKVSTSHWELRHVKIGNQKPALFEIAHGYAKPPVEAATPLLGIRLGPAPAR
jgi:hypothetical protein